MPATATAPTTNLKKGIQRDAINAALDAGLVKARDIIRHVQRHAGVHVTPQYIAILKSRWRKTHRGAPQGGSGASATQRATAIAAGNGAAASGLPVNRLRGAGTGAGRAGRTQSGKRRAGAIEHPLPATYKLTVKTATPLLEQTIHEVLSKPDGLEQLRELVHMLGTP